MRRWQRSRGPAPRSHERLLRQKWLTRTVLADVAQEANSRLAGYTGGLHDRSGAQQKCLIAHVRPGWCVDHMDPFLRFVLR